MRHFRITLITILMCLTAIQAPQAANVTNITVKTTEAVTVVTINGDAPLVYRTTEFTDPSLRLVVDIDGASYAWRERYLLVEDGTVLGLRFNQRRANPPITRVVIDRTTNTSFNLVSRGNSIIIEFTHQKKGAAAKTVYVGQAPRKVPQPKTKPSRVGTISNVQISEAGNEMRLVVDGKNLADYRVFSLKNPARLVIDMKAVLGQDVVRKRAINRGGLVEVRLGQFQSQPDPIARVVFQFDKPTQYKVENFNGRPGVIIEFEAAGLPPAALPAPALSLPKPVEKKPSGTPPPPPPQKAPTPEPSTKIFRQAVSLNYQHKPANQILKMLGDKYGMVFKGKLPRNRISIRLKQVSVFNAVSEILALCSYDFQREGSVITLIKQKKPPQKETTKPFVIRPQFQDEKRAQKVFLDLKLIQLNSLLKDRLKIIWQPFDGTYSKHLVLGLPQDEKDFQQTLQQMRIAKEITDINGSLLQMKSGEKDRVVLGQRGQFLTERRDQEGNLVLEKFFYDLGYKMVVQGTIYGSKIKVWVNTYASVIPVSGVVKKPLVIRREVTQEIEVNDKSTIIVGGIIRSEDKLTQEQKSMIRKIPLLGKVAASESVERIPIEVMAIIHCYVE